jgi:hypothetical protein
MPFVSQKAAVLLIAAGIIVAVNCGLIVAGQSLPGLAVLLDGAVSTIVVLMLCLITAPAFYRIIAILSLIVSVLLVISRSDLFGVNPTATVINERVQTAPTAIPTNNGVIAGESSSDRSERTQQGSGTGASVHFIANGVEGVWADRLNAQLDRRIGGDAASSIKIGGQVSSGQGAAVRSINLAWSVTFAGDTVDCGRSSVIGSDDALLIEQIQRSIEIAVDRSVKARRALCL